MADIEAESLAESAVMMGVISREEARAARADAEDGTAEALVKSLMRKGLLTSWQRDRLLKGDFSGFFYGGCKVLFHIAEGTFARVYRGERVQGGDPVAIKVLRRRFTTDPAAVIRFQKEAEAGMRLDHPNIVKILDYGEHDKNFYMIMEYVEGYNLRDFLKYRKRLTPEEALPIMIGLAKGLKYSLERGVTHRDIKGTNILISSRGSAKLVDFGLATIEGDERRMEEAHGQRTVDYSALERTCKSPKGDPRSDIYFLGCVFYQMLTGNLPLPEVETSDQLAKMLKRSFAAIKPLSEHRHAPPAALAQVVEKMMKMDLTRRYQSMSEVVAELEEYSGQIAAGVPSDVAEVHAARVRGAASQAEDAAEEGIDDIISELFGGQQDRQRQPVLCVEVQDAVQEAFRKTLSRMGYRVIMEGDPRNAPARYRADHPAAVVYDADGLGPNALDPFLAIRRSATENGQKLNALVLLGPRQAELSAKLTPDDRLVILSKPIKMKDVQSAIKRLVPAG